jgi:SAM-dependent methyltransferase
MDFDALYKRSCDPWLHYLRVSLQDYDKRYSRILSRYALSPANILEIACGTGYFSKQLSEQYMDARIDACDISLTAIEAAKKLYGEKINFFKDEIPSLQRVGDKYDLIILNEALYYLSSEERIEAVARMRELAAPRRYLFVACNIGEKYFQINDLANLIISWFGEIIYFEYNYNKIYYRLVESPITSLMSKFEVVQYRYTFLRMISAFFRYMIKCILGNRALFIFLQYLCKVVNRENGITNMYILARKNE